VKKIYIAAFAAAALSVGANAVQAQESNVATQVVSFEVQAINLLSVSGSPSLVISASSAGSAPTSVTAGGTYAITTNESNRKITASIDADMPSGVTLSVLFEGPTGASVASQSLSTSAADVVTGISALNESGLDLTYTLSATSAAGVVPAGNRTVTYTIVAGA
jgi:hypothetical protein